MNTMLNLLICLFVVPGLLLAGFGARNVWRDRASAQWPTTPGTVVSSATEDNSDSDGNSYKAKVEYRYSVGGNQHTGKRISFGVDSGVGSRANADRFTAKYAAGTPVTVHYRADQPDLCVLETGLTKRSFVMLAFGVGFAVFALWFWLLAWLMSA